MRHFVNFALLFGFGILATSGVMLFVRPFSLTVARVHIALGLTTIVLVGLHLASRLPYFRARLRTKQFRGVPIDAVGSFAAAAVLLAAAVIGWRPINLLIEQGYESRHRAEIVRPSALSGFQWADQAESLAVSRAPTEDANLRVSLLVRLQETLAPTPTIAVWAETTAGSMIETLYLDPRVAYSDKPTWHGNQVDRAKVLPIWRHRYTLVSGVAPGGEADAVTGTTPSHSFSLDNYLSAGDASEIVLCVELNAPHDPNETYADPQLGQPSLLYTAYLELDNEQPYALFELTARGDDTPSGTLRYDLEEITTAKQLVDLILAKVESIGE